MSFLCVSKIRRRDLLRSDTSNTSLEWTGHPQLSAKPPQALCLPLKGGVRWTQSLKAQMKSISVQPSESFYPHPAQGTYADPSKSTTNWQTAQQRHRHSGSLEQRSKEAGFYTRCEARAGSCGGFSKKN